MINDDIQEAIGYVRLLLILFVKICLVFLIQIECIIHLCYINFMTYYKYYYFGFVFRIFVTMFYIIYHRIIYR